MPRPQSRTTVHERLIAYLMERILAADTGDKLPSIRQIHARFRCSHATIDRALNELDYKGYIERRPGSGLYVASPEKRILAEQTNRSPNGRVIFAYPNYISHEFALLLREAENRAVQRGYKLVNVRLKVDTSYAYLFEQIKHTEDIQGVLIFPGGSSLEQAVYSRFARLPFPTTLLWPNACDRRPRNLNFVCPDYDASGYQLASHLLACGGEPLAYVHNEPTSIISRLRYHGIKRALYEHGHKLRDLIRATGKTAAWTDACAPAYASTLALLKARRRPRALLYDSSAGALAGLRALHDLGLTCPDDVAVAAEGHNEFNHYLSPRITTTEYDPGELMRQAFDSLTEAPGRPRDVTVPLSLNIRESAPRRCDG